jgi:hypothetical protein
MTFTSTQAVYTCFPATAVVQAASGSSWRGGKGAPSLRLPAPRSLVPPQYFRASVEAPRRAGRRVAPGRGRSFPDHGQSLSVFPSARCLSRRSRINSCFSVTGSSHRTREPAHTSRTFSSKILSAVERYPGSVKSHHVQHAGPVQRRQAAGIAPVGLDRSSSILLTLAAALLALSSPAFTARPTARLLSAI